MKEKGKEGLVVTVVAVVNWILFIMTFFLHFILKKIIHFFPLILTKRKQTPIAHSVFSENVTVLP